MAIYGPPGLVERDEESLRRYELGEAWMGMDELLEMY
jgi:hypothetical protein